VLKILLVFIYTILAWLYLGHSFISFWRKQYPEDQPVFLFPGNEQSRWLAFCFWPYALAAMLIKDMAHIKKYYGIALRLAFSMGWRITVCILIIQLHHQIFLVAH
jgi:hypothetical protein